MKITRRSMLGLSAAAVATAAAYSAGTTSAARAAQAAPAGFALRRDGDVVGRITTGYQGWFATPDDSSPIGQWWHWATDGKNPTVSTSSIISWPDVRAYDRRYAVDMPPLGNGLPAELYSNADEQTVDVQFRWMAENAIHTAAVQRFDTTTAERPQRDIVLGHVRRAAERHGVKFFVMYDVSGWADMRDTLPQDWDERMADMVASPAYARQDGKPVVAIWGFGFNDGARSMLSPQVCKEVIDWFHQRGVYVIGGVPTHWRSAVTDSFGDAAPGFQDVFHSFDMLSPWMVGRLHSPETSDDTRRLLTEADLADCTAHGIDYQPCVIPGDLQQGHRQHGETMWRQFYNHASAGVYSAYVTMFDE